MSPIAKGGRVLGVIAVALVVAAAGLNANSAGSGVDARKKLTVIAPASAGGGWDLVARETQRALRTNGVVNNVQVVNVPGAAGTIGLSQMARLDGESTTIMVTGTTMIAGIIRNDSATTLPDLTPLARLAEDFEVLVVPESSPYQTLDDLLKDWKANPGALPIGGGSAGGLDHMVAALLAREAGIDPAKIQYSAYAGGGELTISLLSTAPGTPNVGLSGYNEFRDLLTDGRLRALAVVAPERLEGLDAPTMAEAGYPAVDLVNWRGLVAPAGISEEERQALIGIVTELVETEEWRSAVGRNFWKDSFITGDDFTAFIGEEEERITTILKDLGLA